MKLTCKLVLDETLPRNESAGQPNDYFLALQITSVDDAPITTTKDLYNAIYGKVPDIRVEGGEASLLLNDQFTSAPPPTVRFADGQFRPLSDMAHFTLGYFTDFRKGRNINAPVDIDLVDKAQALVKQMKNEPVFIEISPQADFKLVIASSEPSIIKHAQNLIPALEVTTAPTVGVGKDAIMNIQPKTDDQTILAELSRKVFGKEFVLWRAPNTPVVYHLTALQAQGIPATLMSFCAQLNEKEKRNEKNEHVSMSM